VINGSFVKIAVIPVIAVFAAILANLANLAICTVIYIVKQQIAANCRKLRKLPQNSKIAIKMAIAVESLSVQHTYTTSIRNCTVISRAEFHGARTVLCTMPGDVVYCNTHCRNS
jgi:hypothetical protein